jgi:hypothetical protein
MLPRFSPALFKLAARLILLALLAPIGVLAQSNAPNGIIESLEGLIKLHREQFDKVAQTAAANPNVLFGREDLKDVRLNPYFLRSLIFSSSSQLIEVVKKDECLLYSMLENRLLRGARGDIDEVIADIELADGKIETGMVTRADFLAATYKKKCFNNLQLGTLFLPENLKKTLDGISFRIPKQASECQQLVYDWKSNPYFPYLCGVSHTIKEGNLAQVQLNNSQGLNVYLRRKAEEKARLSTAIKDKVEYLQMSYLDNLCQNLDDPEKFCSPFLAKDYWSRAVNGDLPNYALMQKCLGSVKKTNLSKTDLQTCAKFFREDSKACVTRGNRDRPSLFPMPNCELESEALVQGRLFTNYHDCPGNIDNEALTNIHRISTHIAEQVNDNSASRCASQTNYTLAKLYQDFKRQEAWNLKICYKDRANGEAVCIPYLPGSMPGSELDEGSVVATVLKKIHSLPDKTTCLVVDSNTYRPNLLEYKGGCFVVRDSDLCTTLHCPRKIIFDGKEMSGVEYIGKPIFDYFPNSYSKEEFALTNILNKVHKKEQRTIRNFTELEAHFKTSQKGIIHGIGCAEDLLPQFFSARGLNQCRPLPLIIDGIVEAKNERLLSIRTAIDDLHSPRLIPWNRVFSAVSQYKEQHPLSTWTLYAIK